MTSWPRPSKRSLRVCVPCSPSKGYGFSTSSQGSWRRSRLSWSRMWVNSFSFARCFFRALSHSSCFTTLWVGMAIPPLRFRIGPAQRRRLLLGGREAEVAGVGNVGAPPIIPFVAIHPENGPLAHARLPVDDSTLAQGPEVERGRLELDLDGVRGPCQRIPGVDELAGDVPLAPPHPKFVSIAGDVRLASPQPKVVRRSVTGPRFPTESRVPRFGDGNDCGPSVRTMLDEGRFRLHADHGIRGVRHGLHAAGAGRGEHDKPGGSGRFPRTHGHGVRTRNTSSTTRSARASSAQARS